MQEEFLCPSSNIKKNKIKGRILLSVHSTGFMHIILYKKSCLDDGLHKQQTLTEGWSFPKAKFGGWFGENYSTRGIELLHQDSSKLVYLREEKFNHLISICKYL